MNNNVTNDNKLVESIIRILHEEILPAEGCTEPIAIAYTAAKATEYLEKKPENIKIYVSGNMIKNVKSVVIPNSEGRVGIEVAGAMGALFGNPNEELLVISNVKKEDLAEVESYIKEGKVEVVHVDSDIKLYAAVEVSSGSHSALVEIKHLHTNITKVIKDGKELINRPCNDADFNSSLTDRSILSIELIYNMAKSIELNLIEELLTTVINYNSRIAKEGLEEKYGVNMGAMIRENIKEGIYGDDQRNRSASFAAAASDARMSGCSLPVMTTSGSGNQGITSSLPIIQYAMDHDLTKEELLRALFFSHLTTVHIKSNIGRLSAYCGVICASASVSGCLSFINGGDLAEVSRAISNTLGNISGVICDGAKASCASKISTGIYSAFDSYMLAKKGLSYKGGEGIIGEDIEATIKNIGRLSLEGMAGTDKTILGIMTNTEVEEK